MSPDFKNHQHAQMFKLKSNTHSFPRAKHTPSDIPSGIDLSLLRHFRYSEQCILPGHNEITCNRLVTRSSRALPPLQFKQNVHSTVQICARTHTRIAMAFSAAARMTSGTAPCLDKAYPPRQESIPSEQPHSARTIASSILCMPPTHWI